MARNTVRFAEPPRTAEVAAVLRLREPRRGASGRLAPGMRWLLFAAAVLVLLAGLQLFVFTGRTGAFFAWTIANPLAAAFLGAGYWASCLDRGARRTPAGVGQRPDRGADGAGVHRAHAGRHPDPPGPVPSRRPVPGGHARVTVAWIAIYVLVPALMLIVRPCRRAPRVRTHPGSPRCPAGSSPAGRAGGHAARPRHRAVRRARASRTAWPWTLTPLVAQATGAWLISLGVAAAHALLERDARRLRPAAIGYLLLRRFRSSRWPGSRRSSTGAPRPGSST